MGRHPRWDRATCESYIPIDVRNLHREGRLRASQRFSWSWTWRSEPSVTVVIRTEAKAVVVNFPSYRRDGREPNFIEQRILIGWTECHFGGRRPWFLCPANSNGHCCGRRVAVLYAADGPFACRHCYGLDYASQHQPPRFRGISQSQKIRERLSGSLSIFDPFPEKPKRMHWRTYYRLRERAELAEAVTKNWIMHSFERGERVAANGADKL